MWNAWSGWEVSCWILRCFLRRSHCFKDKWEREMEYREKNARSCCNLQKNYLLLSLFDWRYTLLQTSIRAVEALETFEKHWHFSGLQLNRKLNLRCHQTTTTLWSTIFAQAIDTKNMRTSEILGRRMTCRIRRSTFFCMLPPPPSLLYRPIKSAPLASFWSSSTTAAAIAWSNVNVIILVLNHFIRVLNLDRLQRR